jgi:hypothetical protein
MNDSIQADAIAGRISGKVMTQNTFQGRAPRSMAASSSDRPTVGKSGPE